MNTVTYTEFTSFLGKHGWPQATHEFGKRYTVARYECIGTFDGVTSMKVAERHATLSRGKEVSVSYLIPV
jgi:hypothetical protein